MTQWCSVVGLLTFLFFAGCNLAQKERVEIVERWDNGAKKTVTSYFDEGRDEQLVSEELYTSDGKLFMKVNYATSDTTYLYDLYEYNSSNVTSGKWIHYEENIEQIRYDTLIIESDKLIWSSKIIFDDNRLHFYTEGVIRENSSSQSFVIPIKDIFQIESDLYSSESETSINFNALSEDGRILVNKKRDGYSGESENEELMDDDYLNIFLDFKRDTLIVDVRNLSALKFRLLE